MLFSVIIPTCNRVEQLSKCLALLKPDIQLINSEIYEVIVSDDSKDDSAMMLIQQKFGRVKYINGPKRGPGANRNNGAKQANGEWLIFIDDDCIPEPGLLKAYRNGINNNKSSMAFEGAICPDNWELLKKDMAECPVNMKGGCFWSANICVNKNFFKQIGGFNEDYKIAAQEDQQLKIDIEKSTHSIISFLADAIVIHPVRFLSVKKKISDMPVASKNFCLYAYKNKHTLGYNSFFKFFKNQVTTHVRFSFQQLRKRKYRNFFVAITWLFLGVPLNVINYLGFTYREGKR